MSSPEQYQQQKARVARWMAAWLAVDLLKFVGFVACVAGMLWAGEGNRQGWVLAFYLILLSYKIFDYVLFKSAEYLDPEVAQDLPRASLFGVVLVVALGLLLITKNSW